MKTAALGFRPGPREGNTGASRGERRGMDCGMERREKGGGAEGVPLSLYLSRCLWACAVVCSPSVWL